MEVDKYEALDIIGRGSFGIIRKVKRKSDGHILCRKEISYLRMSQKEREQLQAELSILKGLRHRNIVAYYEREHLKSSQDLHIYMEYCEEGDLARKIRHMKASNQMAEEDFVWSVFAQLVCGLYRCHKGQDPPEIGKNVIGLGSDARPKDVKSENVVLHRDLKPDNIFLGADASVKIGDFGLSKIIASHDFASTYVGTPFYMSPEICAAEAYGWASDIWALGCVVYELCAKEPPFNARTHLELIQKIRMGRVKPLPSFYSKELQDVVMQCIRVNQQTRPDTASLLNLPMVKLKRKEMEMVDLGRKMQARIEQANQKTKEAEQSIAREKDTLRREWEVKARLEIDRQVEKTRLRLEGEFKAKVEAMVHQEVTKIKKELESRPASRQEELRPSSDMYVRSSTPDLADLPEETILDELSLNSPTATRTKPPQKKTSRTPFTRARTMIDNSPIDVDMRDSTPSAPSIANLGLSPRQTRPQSSASSRSRKNIFTTTSQSSDKGSPSTSTSAATEESEDEGDSLALPPLAQPKDPFQNAVRPGLKRQATAPTKQGRPLSSIFKRPVSPTKSKENIDPNPLSRPSKLPARMPASPTKDLQGRSLVELSSATTWDPERDEMPSPFLSKMGRQPLLKGYRGGPGLSHLR